MKENNKSKMRSIFCRISSRYDTKQTKHTDLLFFLNMIKGEIIFKSVYTKEKHVNNINVIDKRFFYKLNEL